MHTQDMAEANIEKIGQLFPNCLTERIVGKDKDGKDIVDKAIDFDKLKQELSKEIVEGNQERYQFTWPGKREAMRLANTPSNMTLRPDRESSVDFDNTENLYIEGDNLEVLKLLRENYLGKVKMIYIDPPYNTGNDFVYEDDFTQTTSEFKDKSGMFDENGQMLLQNYEVNADSNGRFHTDWLNMMYPRLKVAKDLLREDGVIFISIDENEVENLKKVCSEIFGSDKYVGSIVLQTATDNNPGQIKIEHEYVLCYCLDKKKSGNWTAEKEEIKLIQQAYGKFKSRYGTDIATIQSELRKWIKENKMQIQGLAHYDNVDDRGVFHDGDIANTVFGGYQYDIIHPITGKVCKRPDKGYRFPEETMKEMLRNNDIMFGADETTLPKPKIRLEDAKDMLRSVIYEDGRSSTKRFESLMSRDIFQNPKSDTIISRFTNFVCNDGDIVMDFFSGSATTAEAAFLLGEKNKHLKWILVQIPENLDETIKHASSKAKKTLANAIEFLNSIQKPHTICEIGKERIRRAGKKILEEQQSKKNEADLFNSAEPKHTLDIGFRVLKLDTSNMQNVYYKPEDFSENTLFEDNVKPDRTSEDLLFQVMLECNLPLSAKIEKKTIAGKEVFNVNDGYLLACFDEDVNETVITEVAKQKPYYFIMRDKSLSEDNVADNFEQIFNAYSKDTIRKIL